MKRAWFITGGVIAAIVGTGLQPHTPLTPRTDKPGVIVAGHWPEGKPRPGNTALDVAVMRVCAGGSARTALPGYPWGWDAVRLTATQWCTITRP